MTYQEPPAGDRPEKLSPSELQSYWSALSETFLKDQANHLSAVCYARMPTWFNSFVNRYQRKSFARMTKGLPIGGGMVLDVGTGLGRWAARFSALPSTTVVGIDLEPQRLRQAQVDHQGKAAWCVMSADRFAFATSTFDVVNCVTVLQHVDHDTKMAALAEIARVLRPEGIAMLMELTDETDTARHVFPWSQHTWINAASACGLRLVRIVGSEYTPLLRIAKAVSSRFADPDLASTFRKPGTQERGVGTIKRFTLELLLRTAVYLSYPIEELCMATVSARFARINGFVFRKAEELQP